MQLVKLDLDPANVDTDGLCASQTPAAGGTQTLLLNGALITSSVFNVEGTNAGESVGVAGRQIAVTSAGNDSARTFAVTGTNENKVAQTESITGPNVGTTESTKYWNTVTAITIDGNAAGAITVGTVDEVITKSIPLNWLSSDAATVAVLGLTGTCQFDIDETFDNILADGATTANWIVNQTNKTADLAAALTRGATGVRLKFDSYTDGAELQFHLSDL